jgi:hypothetical protein
MLQGIGKFISIPSLVEQLRGTQYYEESLRDLAVKKKIRLPG